jgi:hypothetical protein
MDWLLALFVLAVGVLVYIVWTGLVINWRPKT